jgi:hypothetical protein
MESFVNFAKMRIGDVGVDLSRADVSVAKKRLDGADVGAVHEQVGSERVAESVGSDVFCDAGFPGITLNDTFDGARS